MQLIPNLPEAYRLVHEGILAFARAEQEGMRIDVDYCLKKKEYLTKKIERLDKKLRGTKFYIHWQKVYGAKANPDSNWQLAHLLYNVRKITPMKFTASGKGATDDEALSQIDIPEIKWILEMRKLKKVRDTYLDAFIREQVNGYMHPFFNLHTVKTHRSCVAKGSKVLVMKDFEAQPEGIPIENVKKGDYVYCFDDKLHPSIQKVIWAGKTGHKKVVRVHYTVRGGGKGYVDVTPEHKIRLIDGTYVPAEDLLKKDRRSATDNKHLPKVRVLSCKRVGDQLRFTGHLRYGNGILEHRFIYENFIGILNSQDVVHHKDGNHLNHDIRNLEKLSKREHSAYHCVNVSEEIKKKRIETLRKHRHKIPYKRGKEHPAFISWSRFTCIRILAKSKGIISKNPNFDFGVMKRHLQEYGIDSTLIKIRYDKEGKYISKKRLRILSEKGIATVQKELNLGYYSLKRLYEYNGIPFTRKWANQFGEFQVGNHIITKVEYLDEAVDVYDIEVEKYHNFIVNQICVHNSSERPNFQNIPKRDKEAMEITRKAIFPKPGHQLLEIDYSGVEVRISECYHHDPVMRKYIEDPSSDMHGDMACQIFILDKLDKSIASHKTMRQAAKNGFVFPQFYGDYYVNCAENIACKWCGLSKGKWKKGEGIEHEGGYISDHLIANKLDSFDKFTEHIKKIEDDFWNRRFKVYNRWKDKWWGSYQKNGYVSMYTGFRCSGIMRRNECINIPIQGSAFHCLLWSFIQVDKISREQNWKSRLIGQIHDAMVLDVHPDELDMVASTVHRITCEDLPKHWSWINVPLEVEAEVCPVDCSWNEKGDYHFK